MFLTVRQQYKHIFHTFATRLIVAELENTVQNLKFDVPHETYLKAESKSRAKFAKAKPNLTRFLHEQAKRKEDDHWDAIVEHMKKAGEYHEKASNNLLCYELADHSLRQSFL